MRTALRQLLEGWPSWAFCFLDLDTDLRGLVIWKFRNLVILELKHTEREQRASPVLLSWILGGRLIFGLKLVNIDPDSYAIHPVA